jgi:hypothetical protein
VLQFVVINVLAPKIMSQSVGIHPLLVFAAVLVGAKLAGGWGAIFGVPLAAMLYLMARAFYQRVVLHLPLYRQGEPLSPDALVPSRSVHVDAHAGRLGGGAVTHGGHAAHVPPAPAKSPPPAPATPAPAAPPSGA